LPICADDTLKDEQHKAAKSIEKNHINYPFCALDCVIAGESYIFGELMHSLVGFSEVDSHPIVDLLKQGA
jgi:hypothetical protein